jgi:hypothetical protein
MEKISERFAPYSDMGASGKPPDLPFDFIIAETTEQDEEVSNYIPAVIVEPLQSRLANHVAKVTEAIEPEAAKSAVLFFGHSIDQRGNKGMSNHRDDGTYFPVAVPTLTMCRVEHFLDESRIEHGLFCPFPVVVDENLADVCHGFKIGTFEKKGRQIFQVAPDAVPLFLKGDNFHDLGDDAGDLYFDIF